MNKDVISFAELHMGETIVKRKTCKWSGKKFPLFQGDKDMLRKLSPVVGGQTFSLGEPSLSPAMRQMRRMMFMNYRKLYKRKSDLSGKSIVSNLSPSYNGPVYDVDEARGDEWNPLDYGVSIENVTKDNLMKTIGGLYRSVPMMGRLAGFNEQCPYVSACGNSKKCHFIFDSDYCEECLYSEVIKRSSRLVDCVYCDDSELLYDCVDCHKCFKLIHGQNCINVRDSYFVYNCDNCSHCLFCANLVGKKYCRGNKQLSKEEYFAKVSVMKEQLASYSGRKKLVQQFSQLINKTVHKALMIDSNSNDCLGNNIATSNNAHWCFDVGECEDIRYCNSIHKAKNCMDMSSFGFDVEKIFESTSAGIGANGVYGCACAPGLRHGFFSANCFMSDHIFGCSGLYGNQSYCLFNKKYEKEEWLKHTQRILGWMMEDDCSLKLGEFWEPQWSPFPFNDSLAFDYYEPEQIISDERAVHDALHNRKREKSSGTRLFILEPEKFVSKAIFDLGATKIETSWRTRELETNIPEGSHLTEAKELDDRFEETIETAIQKTLVCQESKRAFRLTQQECLFYKKIGLPLPRQHPEVRIKKLLKRRTHRSLFTRKCSKTGKEIISAYTQDADFPVFGREVYDKLVYG